MFGLLGLSFGLILWHAWLDHQNLHAVLAYVVQQAEAAKKASGQ